MYAKDDIKFTNQNSGKDIRSDRECRLTRIENLVGLAKTNSVSKARCKQSPIQFEPLLFPAEVGGAAPGVLGFNVSERFQSRQSCCFRFFGEGSGRK
jgi:hypothetical protein